MVKNDALQVEFKSLAEHSAPGKIAPPVTLSVMCQKLDTVVYTYALHLAELLDAQTLHVSPDQKELPPQLVENSDLLIYHIPKQSRLKTMVCGSPACRVVSRLPVSVLVVRQPSWPLRKILMITRGRPLDFAAASWVAHLASPIRAEISVLAVQPYLATANSRAISGAGVDTWLTSDTPLGQQLRYILKISGIVPWQLHLQFRGGSPDRQMGQAILEAEPDLIVIAAEAGDWCERRVLGELVRPLLQQTDRPVLVAKSAVMPNWCPR